MSYQELENYVNATSQVLVKTPEEGEDVKEMKERRNLSVKVHQVSEELKHLKAKLSDMTASLEIPELKEETFTIPKKLDLTNRQSRSLHELYSKVKDMTAEACKCDEFVRRNFYDFTYHSLRAVHNDLNARVADLQSVEEHMKEQEKDELKKLLSYQKGREKEVEYLEQRWIRLFSTVCQSKKL